MPQEIRKKIENRNENVFLMENGRRNNIKY